MRDRRAVDDLTIEELEQILRIKKRQARMDRLRRFEKQGRRPTGTSPSEWEEEAPPPAPDDPPEISHRSFLRRSPGQRRGMRDHLLLAIELLAVLGLLAILVVTAFTLRDINEEAASAQAEEIAALPTPSATPIIGTVVLPGGHTPPTDEGSAQPNYDEVPQHLRPLVEQQFAGPVILPTPSPSNAIRIRVPAIGVDAPIVQGDGWEQLKKGVGQHVGSSNPGPNGNVVLSAHNDIYGEIFRYLDELQEGDEIILQTLTQEYVYRVVHWRVVSPTDVGVMEQTPDPITTLISCYPYLVDSQRIVVVAELER